MRTHEEIMEMMGHDPDAVAEELIRFRSLLQSCKDYFKTRNLGRNADELLVEIASALSANDPSSPAADEGDGGAQKGGGK